MTRELVPEDVDEIVGMWRERAGGMDVQTCATCGALVEDVWLSRLKHANWHVRQGHASVQGTP